MRLYAYKAYDYTGSYHYGELWGTNPCAIRAILETQGLRCLRCRPRYRFQRHLRPAQQRDLCQQLATLIRAHIPLNEALSILSKCTQGLPQAALLHIKSQVEAGQYLASALRMHPALFDTLFCNLVAVGEQTGTLDRMLTQAVHYQDKSLSLRRKLQSALAYPIFVLSLALLLTLFLLVVVLPEFAHLFEKFHTPLPPLSAALLKLADGVRRYGALFLGGTIGAALLLWRATKRWPHFQERLANVGYRIPIWGPFFHKVLLARFCYTFGLTLNAGIPILEALPLAARAMGSPGYTRALQAVSVSLSQGKSVHQALAASGRFPPMLIQWVATGETSGTLDTLLLQVSSHYEEELTNTIESLHRLLEPCIMVILGGLIGTLVIAMYWPIFKMGTVF